MNARQAVIESTRLHDLMTRASDGKSDFCPLWVVDPGISPLRASRWPAMYKMMAEGKRTCQCCNGSAWHTGMVEMLPGYFALTTWKCGNCDERGMEAFVCYN